MFSDSFQQFIFIYAFWVIAPQVSAGEPMRLSKQFREAVCGICILIPIPELL